LKRNKGKCIPSISIDQLCPNQNQQPPNSGRQASHIEQLTAHTAEKSSNNGSPRRWRSSALHHTECSNGAHALPLLRTAGPRLQRQSGAPPRAGQRAWNYSDSGSAEGDQRRAGRLGHRSGDGCACFRRCDNRTQAPLGQPPLRGAGGGSETRAGPGRARATIPGRAPG
jgi:hypothetical protein